jgi:hypothetical protein
MEIDMHTWISVLSPVLTSLISVSGSSLSLRLELLSAGGRLGGLAAANLVIIRPCDDSVVNVFETGAYR